MILRVLFAWLLLCGAAVAQVGQIPGWVPVQPAAAAVCTSVYVTGDRTASIAVTFTGTLLNPAASLLVDGSYVTASGPPGSTFFNSSATNTSADQIVFDFGVGNTKLVTEAKWYQGSSPTHGTWQWIGSSNGTTGTNIGASFTLGGVADPGGGTASQVITTLNGNVTQYRYYILQGVSGTRSGSPWLEEVEFKQCP